MKIVKPALLYFAVVLAAGFFFGTIRTVWIVPRIGSRAAELLEMPLMFAAIVLAARWILRRVSEARATVLLAIGFMAMAFMLAAEFGLVLRLRGITLADYFATLDPVTGSAFYAMQVMMGLMPFLLWRRRERH